MTAQVEEKLVLDGTETSMATIPPLPHGHPRLVDRTTPIEDKYQALMEQPGADYEVLSREMEGEVSAAIGGLTSAWWRRYVGSWEVRDDRLYLVSISGKYQLLGPDPLFAEWFTGEIEIRKGKVLRIFNIAGDGFYEAHTYLTVERGVVTARHVIDNLHDLGIANFELDRHCGAGGRPAALDRIASSASYLVDLLDWKYTDDVRLTWLRGDALETLLDTWRTVPGTRADGSFDEDVFAAYVREARGLVETGDQWLSYEVEKVLARLLGVAVFEGKGRWLPGTVLTLLENCAANRTGVDLGGSDRLIREFEYMWIERLGKHSASVEDWDSLADRFRAAAQAARSSHPLIAEGLLRMCADSCARCGTRTEISPTPRPTEPDELAVDDKATAPESLPPASSQK